MCFHPQRLWYSARVQRLPLDLSWFPLEVKLSSGIDAVELSGPLVSPAERWLGFQNSVSRLIAAALVKHCVCVCVCVTEL